MKRKATKKTTVKKKSIPAAKGAVATKKQKKDVSRQKLLQEADLLPKQVTQVELKKLNKATKYRPEMCIKLVELMAQGKSKEVAAIELGINKSTLYDWINEGTPEDPNPRYKEDFCEALEIGELFCQRWWEEVGRLNLHNKDFNATLYMMNMQNRFKWSRRIDGKIDVDVEHKHEHNHKLFEERTNEHSAEVLKILYESNALDKRDKNIIDAEVH